MSRIAHEYVWSSFYGARIIGQCPVCQKDIHADIHSSNEGWHRGHIISMADKGLDILPNVIPICVQCNRSMGKMDMWSYMAHLGKIDPLTACTKKLEHEEICRLFNPRCEHPGCTTNKVCAKLNRCLRHIPYVEMDLDP